VKTYASSRPLNKTTAVRMQGTKIKFESFAVPSISPAVQIYKPYTQPRREPRGSSKIRTSRPTALSKMASAEIFAAGMINTRERQHHKAPACVSVRHTRAMDLCSLHANEYIYTWSHRIMLGTAGYFGSICIAPWGASRRSATDSHGVGPRCENHSA
jgi:hypothetical protein